MSKPMKNMTQTSSAMSGTSSETSSALVVQKDDMALVNSLLRKCVNDSHQDATSRIAQLELQFNVFQQLLMAKTGSEGGRTMINNCARMATMAVKDYVPSTGMTFQKQWDDDFSDDDAVQTTPAAQPAAQPAAPKPPVKSELKPKVLNGSNLHQVLAAEAVGKEGHTGLRVMGECTGRWIQCNEDEQMKYNMFSEVLNLYAKDVFNELVEDGFKGDGVQKETVKRFKTLDQEKMDALIERVKEDLKANPKKDRKGEIPKNISELPALKPAFEYPCKAIFEHEDGKTTRDLSKSNTCRHVDKKTGEVTVKTMKSQKDLADERHEKLLADKEEAATIAANKRAREEAQQPEEAEKRQKSGEALDEE